MQGTHNHDNYHCVLKKLKVCTGMVHDHIDLRFTKHGQKNVEYLS